jgi:molybdopterin/thiamine biosynthesis adenylyltransferase
VVVAGAGGLGCSASIYLAATGIDTIHIINKDIELNHLNRQNIQIETIKETLTEDYVKDFVSGFDGFADAIDNIQTRLIINRAGQ